MDGINKLDNGQLDAFLERTCRDGISVTSEDGPAADLHEEDILVSP